MVFSLRDFPANIFLPPIPVLNYIVTPSSHRVPRPRFLFPSHVAPSRTSIPPYTHQQVFSIHGIRMPSQHSKLTCIHGNSITEFIPRNEDRNDLQFYNFYNIYNNIKHINNFRKILTHILLLSPFLVGREGHWLRPIKQVTYRESSYNY